MANNNDKFISRENAKTLWGYMIDLLTGKQNKLTFDETPTQSSDNPVKSGGIFTALAGKGTYSKPSGGIPKTDLESAVQTSLGLADSALQSETDPTVPSWAKQTNKPAYNSDEISDTNQIQKFATAAQLNQISTNQNNILYAINTGVRNLMPVKSGTNSSAYKWVTGKSGTEHTDENSVDVYIPAGTYNFKATTNGDSGSSAVAQIKFKFTDNTTANSDPFPIAATCGVSFTLNKEVKSLGVYCGLYPYTFDNMRICPSVVDDSTYIEPSLPNQDLTVLEAEDRAALAEVVDSGAKNLATLATISMSASGSSAENIAITLKAGSYAVSYDYTVTSGNVQLYFTGGGYTHECTSKSGSGHYEEIITVPSDVTTYYRVYSSGSAATVSNIMVCTKAAFDASQKFVPYRMPYDDVQSKTTLLMNNMGGLAFAGNDLNTLVAGGRYLVNNSTDNPVSNAPYNSWQTVEVFQSDYGTYPKVFYQIATDVTGATVTSKWRRRVYNSGGQYNAWTSWSS